MWCVCSNASSVVIQYYAGFAGFQLFTSLIRTRVSLSSGAQIVCAYECIFWAYKCILQIRRKWSRCRFFDFFYRISSIRLPSPAMLFYLEMVRVCVHMYVCRGVCASVRVCVHMHVCRGVCASVRVCVHMYWICTYTLTYAHTPLPTYNDRRIGE